MSEKPKVPRPPEGKEHPIIACEKHKPSLRALAETVEREGSIDEEAMEKVINEVENCEDCARLALEEMAPYLGPKKGDTVH